MLEFLVLGEECPCTWQRGSTIWAKSGVLLPPTDSPKTKSGIELGEDYTQNMRGGAKASGMHTGPPTPRASHEVYIQVAGTRKTFD